MNCNGKRKNKTKKEPLLQAGPFQAPLQRHTPESKHFPLLEHSGVPGHVTLSVFLK